MPLDTVIHSIKIEIRSSQISAEPKENPERDRLTAKHFSKKVDKKSLYNLVSKAYHSRKMQIHGKEEPNLTANFIRSTSNLNGRDVTKNADYLLLKSNDESIPINEVFDIIIFLDAKKCGKEYDFWMKKALGNDDIFDESCRAIMRLLIKELGYRGSFVEALQYGNMALKAKPSKLQDLSHMQKFDLLVNLCVFASNASR